MQFVDSALHVAFASSQTCLTCFHELCDKLDLVALHSTGQYVNVITLQTEMLCRADEMGLYDGYMLQSAVFATAQMPQSRAPAWLCQQQTAGVIEVVRETAPGCRLPEIGRCCGCGSPARSTGHSACALPDLAACGAILHHGVEAAWTD